MLRAALRATLIALLVAIHLITASRRPNADQRRVTVVTSRRARWAVRILGLRVRRQGRRITAPGRLVVLNHGSWLDPLLLSALAPAVFVTSVETAEDSLLGRICTAAGCVFMERRRRAGLVDECARLATLMRHQTVVVFPEATSSDGTRLLPFRPASFAAASVAQVPIELLALRYTHLDGRPMNARTRDRIHWHGAMTFLPHLLRLFTCQRIDAHLVALGAMSSTAGDRRTLASTAHTRIAHALDLPPTVPTRLPAAA